MNFFVLGEDDRNKVDAAITRTWVIREDNIPSSQVIENKTEKDVRFHLNTWLFQVKPDGFMAVKWDIYALTGSATVSRIFAQFLPLRAAGACLWKA